MNCKQGNGIHTVHLAGGKKASDKFGYSNEKKKSDALEHAKTETDEAECSNRQEPPGDSDGPYAVVLGGYCRSVYYLTMYTTESAKVEKNTAACIN